jgi:predicted small metal-binding protein
LSQNIGIRLLPFLQFEKMISLPKEGLRMARELRCADLMPGCNFVAHGKDDSEVMQKTAAHAKSVHKMAAISMEVEKKARAAIRDAEA